MSTTVDKVKGWIPHIAVGAGIALIIVVLISAYRSSRRSATAGAMVQPLPYYDTYSTPYGAGLTNEYPVVQAPGCNRVGRCMNSEAANYDPNANCPCMGCCQKKIYGCLDPTNVNYNRWANTNDSRFCAKDIVCPSQGSATTVTNVVAEVVPMDSVAGEMATP